MFSPAFHPVLAATGYEVLHQLVTTYKVHPVLVNFTAALLPISLFSDLLAAFFARPSLRHTAWWTLCFAAFITPFTAAAGWFFWMPDDNGVQGMTIHRWLGTGLAVVLVGLASWRWRFFRNDRGASAAYLLVALVVLAALVYQGHLGGQQSFGAM